MSLAVYWPCDVERFTLQFFLIHEKKPLIKFSFWKKESNIESSDPNEDHLKPELSTSTTGLDPIATESTISTTQTNSVSNLSSQEYHLKWIKWKVGNSGSNGSNNNNNNNNGNGNGNDNVFCFYFNFKNCSFHDYIIQRGMVFYC